MLYWMTQFADGGGIFNLFKYITFRAGCAFITALIFGFIFGRPLIDLLRRKQGKGQPIREDGPQSHFSKAGTPTMGGLLILSALVFATLVWARLDNPYIWIVLLVTLAFGGIGFADDYAKVTKQNTKGVSSRIRILLGLLIACLATYAAARFHPVGLTGQLALPVFKNTLVNLGLFYVPFGMFVIVGSANAVNLTDGLDGLAIMPVMIAGATLGVIAYVVGNFNFAEYLGVHFVPGTGEILIFAAALFGAGLGFLWYNAPPAAVFMGDTGSLALGGALGAIAVCIKHEIVLAIVGGLFVVEALSVIIQVAYYKRTKKRIFLMAPIHHPFEKRGWGRTADCDPVLDHLAYSGDAGPCHAEGALGEGLSPAPTLALPVARVAHAGPRLLRGQGSAHLQNFDRDVVGAAHKGHMPVARRAVDRDPCGGQFGADVIDVFKLVSQMAKVPPV